MELSNDLISQFAKLTNDKDKKKSTETIVYGTTVEYNDRIYVKIDGSDLLTPVETTTDVKGDQRVTILMKDHSATITGNITDPSVGQGKVDDAKEEVLDDVSNNYTTKEVTMSVSQTADKINWIIQNGTSATDMTLTESACKIFSDNITLSADNINLEGYISANKNFKIDTFGNMIATNGKFNGEITGATNLSIGTSSDKTRSFLSLDNKAGIFGIGNSVDSNGSIYPAFRVTSSGNLRIGGLSAVVYSDGIQKGIAEITARGTFYSCSSTDPHTFTQISEGKMQICSTGYDDDHGYFLDRKVVIENGELYITSYSDDDHTTRKKEIAILGNTIYSNMYNNITFNDNVYVEGIVKATSVSQTSDRTMKENIKYISNANTISSDDITIDDCYRFIKNELPLATYNYINHSDKKIGFVLQDILCYIDGTDNKIGQLITTQLKYSRENDKLTYDTNNLFGVMLGAMQVMANEIESLKNKLNE